MTGGVSDMRTQVLIIGGGITGLRIGSLLSETDISFKIIESRERLGGRVLTKNLDSSNYFDLGPTWFWPDNEKNIEKLLKEYNIPTIEQYNEGDSLLDLSETQTPKRFQSSNVNPASKRIVGGVNSLVEALKDNVPQSHIELHAKVKSISSKTNHPHSIEILNQYTNEIETIKADIIVSTLPPRLVVNSISFTPPLPETLQLDLLNKPTWMGAQAKIVVTYEKAFWRNDGLSGNVISWAGPLREIYDATTPEGKAALFGFFSLPPSIRNEKSEETIKNLVIKQLIKLFGNEAQYFENIFYKDWSQDFHTVTEGDKLNIESFPSYGPSPQHLSHILFSGTEFDEEHGGHIEGALSSANQTFKKIKDILGNNSIIK